MPPVASNISELPVSEFQDLVNRDVRGELAPSVSSQLREPQNLNLWHDTLLKLKRTVEAQLTSNRADLIAKQAELATKGSKGTAEWLAVKASAERWRQGAIRFKNGVEERLAEAKRIRNQVIEESFTSSLVKDRDRAMVEAAKLRSAILEHKEAVLSDKDDEATDDRLWGVLGSELV